MRWLHWIRQEWMVFLLSIVLLGGLGGLFLSCYQSLVAPLLPQVGCFDIPAVPDYLATDSASDAIAALNHPHICQIYDVGPDYLVLEYIEGRPLTGPLPVPEAL